MQKFKYLLFVMCYNQPTPVSDSLLMLFLVQFVVCTTMFSAAHTTKTIQAIMFNAILIE